MALTIVPGPLPADGTRIQIANTLNAFVSGTEITQFDTEEFQGGEIGFVTSATLPPATDFRSRGDLWFKRGEGKLYLWVLTPPASADFAPSTTTGISEGTWVSISDRKEQLVKFETPGLEGNILQMDTILNDWKHEMSSELVPRWTMRVIARDPGDTFLNRAWIVDPVFVAQSEAQELNYRAVVDVGFTPALVRGGVAPDGEPTFGMMNALLENNVLTATTYSSWASNSTRAGFVVGSAASSAEATREVFVMASLTNLVHGDPSLSSGVSEV